MKELHRRRSFTGQGKFGSAGVSSKIAQRLGRWRPSILDRYLVQQFLQVFFICLFVSVSLFLIIDFFERTKIVVKEEASLVHFFSYLFLKIPLIIHLMTPVAVMVGTLFSLARLSQLSEITAMRSCGVSVLRLVRPLFISALVISFLMLVLGETVVPWSTTRVEEIYNFDIRKKDEKGALSQENFWYRSGSKFFNLGLYDSRKSLINHLTMFELTGDFRPLRRLDASQVGWEGSGVGWVMHDVYEASFENREQIVNSYFKELPLIIKKSPKDFYKLRREPETMNYVELKQYAAKLQGEGVPTSKYQVDLAAKLSFPFVNVIVFLVAVPFALVSARSGKMSMSFVAGATIGFSYYVIHALILSFGAAEMIPVLPAAWGANILFACLGGYLLAGIEL